MPNIAGIEAGGTSIKVAIAEYDDPTKILHQTRIPTTSPTETLAEITTWLDQYSFTAIGVASFGPVDLNKGSDTYGYITTTPKPGWQQVNILQPFLKYGVAIGFDTDVNGAALGEVVWGYHGDITSVAYITVGTGVGVGVVVDGRPVHGLLHTEGGHVPTTRHEKEVLDRGVCPFHPNCIEGFICTGALAARVDRPASELSLVSDLDSTWELCAFYLAQLCTAITMLCSPHVIVIGGGVVVNRGVIMPKIREYLPNIINGYLQCDRLKDMSRYIVLSRHGDNAGLVGALELARQSMK